MLLGGGITDNTFECSGIVGRKFENVHDHAGYLSEGGCSELIEGLAAAVFPVSRSRTFM